MNQESKGPEELKRIHEISDEEHSIVTRIHYEESVRKLPDGIYPGMANDKAYNSMLRYAHEQTTQLQSRIKELEDGLQNFKDDITCQREAEMYEVKDLRHALKNLVHLHLCEQEGLPSGQPTREQWLNAVDIASKVLNKEPLELDDLAWTLGKENESLQSKITSLEAVVKEYGWVSVINRPLFENTTNGWVCTEDGDNEFIAAIETNDGWWIRHCVVEDVKGLCVVGDGENEPAGWELQDVQYWMKFPNAPL